jgi:hypothetical protein
LIPMLIKKELSEPTKDNIMFLFRFCSVTSSMVPSFTNYIEVGLSFA